MTGKETNVEAAAELEEVARVAEEGTRGAAEAEEIVDAGHVGDEPQPSADPNDKPVEEEDKPKRRRR
ncbi:MAG: hypothetical protein ACRDRF_00715 [Pseudonocardiaceae bacterium]